MAIAVGPAVILGATVNDSNNPQFAIKVNPDGSINAVISGGGGGTPGGANTDVQYNNSGAFGGNAGFTYDGSGIISIGQAGVETGAIQLVGTTSGVVTIAAQDAAGTPVFKLPNSVGTNTYVLTTDGGSPATLSWQPPTTGSGLPAGAVNTVQYNAGGGNFGGATNFLISAGNPNVTSGNQYLYGGTIAIQADLVGGNWYFGNAGNLTNSGVRNVGVGDSALLAATSANDSVAVGYHALKANTTGTQNVAVGQLAMVFNISGSQSVAIGDNAAELNQTGSQFVAVGYQALQTSTAIGNGCIAIGWQAMQAGVATGINNIAIGAGSLLAVTIGTNNSAEGTGALAACTSGANNSAEGAGALAAVTISNDNTAIGPNALGGLLDGFANVGLGRNTGANNQHGSNNLFIGQSSGFNSSGSRLTAIGAASLQNSSGSDNIGIGGNAALDLTSGGTNIVIGHSSNPSISPNITTGSNNISLGNDVCVPSPTASNQLVIGNFIYGTGLSGTGTTVSIGLVGLGIIAPTAALHLAASTTANANLRFDPTSAAAPSSPNDGDMWYDGTNLKFRQGGTTHTIV